MPDFRAIPASAVTAYYLTWESANTALPILPCMHDCHLLLDCVKFLLWDDRLVVAFHIILRNLAFIDFFLFGKEIHSVDFLKECVAFVFFICLNAFHRPRCPCLFAAWWGNPISHQYPGNRIRWTSLQEKSVDPTHNFRLFLVYHEVPLMLKLIYGVRKMKK